MKFAEHLSAHITPEWHKQYIQYEAMKQMLYEAQEQAPSPDEGTDEGVIQRFFARFDETFFQFCDKELAKINTFFLEKLAESQRKIANLKSELNISLHLENQERNSPNNLRRRKSTMFARDKSARATASHVRKIHDLKLAFSEFYLSLVLLQNYQTLNFTGFRKILKKHDKLMTTDRGAKWRQDYVETARFYNSKDVDHLIKETEGVFTQDLEGGNRQKAMKRLRVPPLGDQQSPWTTFRVGLFSGIFLVLITAAVLAGVFTDHSHDWAPALRIYRGCFLLILCCFLLGLNTYGWRSSGVNHVLIFELDPRNHLSHQQLLEVAGFFAVIWALSVLGYMFSSVLYVPVFAHPLALVGFLFLYLVNPIHILHYRARTWLLRILFRIVTAPFHHVGFADFWLADQLNSLATVLLDFEYLICFYAIEVDWHIEPNKGTCSTIAYGIRPIFACLPAWFRFAQCLRRYRDTKLVFPHIVNAGKYSTTFFVVLFSTLNKYYKGIHGEETIQNNAFFYLWIASAIISTCYTFIWDIKMDWGLFDKNAGENRFLREEIVYAYKAYYYFAIVEDFIIRFSWTVVVTVGEGEYIHGEILKTILACLEVFRRFIWNFFRLENEHLNNCGQFRAVRDISIAPMEANDQTLLEEMMDDPDGVTNRRKDKRRPIKRGKYEKLVSTWADDDEDL
ncbi:unnamed protein product [Owenia fusiformis]|uniref:Uncharacterized protein n=1 Tax=Owenia fusiformis TaxID=6347 RepID=A0A8J1XWE8_OWEFU|nr:unnamed protein product [Owenia fusiformis]